MRHLLMDPTYPDLVGAAALADPMSGRPLPRPCNDDHTNDSLAEEAFFTFLGRMEIAATRLR